MRWFNTDFFDHKKSLCSRLFLISRWWFPAHLQQGSRRRILRFLPPMLSDWLNPGNRVWHLASGGWQLAFDGWLLVSDFWLLLNDWQLLVTDLWLLVTDLWLLVNDWRLIVTQLWLFVNELWLLASCGWRLAYGKTPEQNNADKS